MRLGPQDFINQRDEARQKTIAMALLLGTAKGHIRALLDALEYCSNNEGVTGEMFSQAKAAAQFLGQKEKEQDT